MNDLEQITLDKPMTNDEIQRYLFRLVEELNYKILDTVEIKEVSSSTPVPTPEPEDVLSEAEAYSDANLQTAKNYSDSKLQEAKSYSDDNLLDAKNYTNGCFSHKIGTSSLSLTLDVACGYLIVVPIGSSANMYFANEYQGSCYSKTMLSPISGLTVSISGNVWTITTTGSAIEYYAVKIFG